MEESKPISTLELLNYELGHDIRAFSSTRIGGVGIGSYASFNINEYCGDNDGTVNANRRHLCNELGIVPDHLIMPHQIHGSTIKVIDDMFLQQPSGGRKEALEDCDGLITSVKDICIGVSTADCVPLLLYDPICKIIGAVHAGWRGTVKRIAASAVKVMKEHFGSDPADLHVVIGPSISLQAFEVGNEVFAKFENAGFPMPLISERFPAAAPYNEKWHIDLWEANRLQLLECGIPREKIFLTGICTYKTYKRFFSARKLGPASGRIFTGIMLN